jgi:repressor LexA
MRLTDRQGEVLDFIRTCIREHGLPPTRVEICRRFGFKSPNAAEDHLRSLRRKGFIELVPAIARGIRISAP